jgi:biotin synthase-related radical SAM superfamily protein
MMYQLVIQFPADTLEDYDDMVALEDRLIADLGTSAEVDGHDFGSGTANIFIRTTEPETTFRTVRKRLEQEGRLQSVTAAHRPRDGEDYTVIWPKASKTAFSIL